MVGMQSPSPQMTHLSSDVRSIRRWAGGCICVAGVGVSCCEEEDVEDADAGLVIVTSSSRVIESIAPGDGCRMGGSGSADPSDSSDVVNDAESSTMGLVVVVVSVVMFVVVVVTGEWRRVFSLSTRMGFTTLSTVSSSSPFSPSSPSSTSSNIFAKFAILS